MHADMPTPRAERKPLPFWGKLKTYFLNHSEKLTNASGGESGPAAGGRTPNAGPIGDTLGEKLAAFANRGQIMSAAEVGVVNLEDVKERAGERWPKLSNRLEVLVSSIIQNRIGKSDFFSQISDTSYLIVFGDSDRESARLKVALLSEEIRHTLLGASETFAGTRVDVNNGRIPSEVLFDEDASHDTLHQALQIEDLNPPWASVRQSIGGPESKTVKDLELGMQYAKRVLETTSADTIEAADEEQVSHLRDVAQSLRHLGVLVGTLVETDSELQDWAASYRLRWKGQLLSPEDAVRSLAIEANRMVRDVCDPWEEQSDPIRVSFESLYYQPKKVIGLYRARLRIDLPGESISYEKTLANTDDQQFISALDQATCQISAQELQAVIGTDQTSAVMIPVSFRTLNWPRGQRDYLSLCRSLSPTLRSLIVWELYDVPADAWIARLAPVTNVVSPYGRMICVRLAAPKDHPPSKRASYYRSLLPRLGALRGAGVRSISYSISEFPGSEAERLSFIDDITEAAEKHGLTLALDGLSTMSLVMGAVGAGAHYLSGHAIADPLHHLGGVESHQLTAFYLRRFKQILAS